MKRYLDPKNDLVFKRVFGEHPHILRAFLNAVLPLGKTEQIVSLEYLSPEQAPEIPLLKHTIVDVRCKDLLGRQFIVEMQMQWTTAFLQRVYFNASKAYVRQLERGEEYELLNPVFGLSLLNDVFEPNTPDYYHHYKMVNVKNVDREIKGLQLVFIELPKFTALESDPQFSGWLRYLQETGNHEQAPEELATLGAEMKEALELAQSAAYSRQELMAYDRYWDAVSTEKTLISGKLAQGRLEGKLEALQDMIASGIPEQEAKKILRLELARLRITCRDSTPSCCTAQFPEQRPVLTRLA